MPFMSCRWLVSDAGNAFVVGPRSGIDAPRRWAYGLDCELSNISKWADATASKLIRSTSSDVSHETTSSLATDRCCCTCCCWIDGNNGTSGISPWFCAVVICEKRGGISKTGYIEMRVFASAMICRRVWRFCSMTLSRGERTYGRLKIRK